ncbi:MAG: hypothetical protein K2N42_05500, partial [Anaeroplasmataceae bacterium]|nr:hypothetical protein [Anaeroplasmataceae bacterium]
EVKVFLNQCQNEFLTRMNQFQKGYQQALEMEKAKKNYTQEDSEQMDQDFMGYCSTHHPLVKAHSSEFERTIYSSLIMLYRTGNISGFKKLFKECMPNFSSPEVSKEEYDKIAGLYKDTIEHLNSLKEKRNMVFPLNKEDIMNKEELITRELMMLREKNYQAREMNQVLQADFKSHFSFEFSL